jgi:hypothetical protein
MQADTAEINQLLQRASKSALYRHTRPKSRSIDITRDIPGQLSAGTHSRDRSIDRSISKEIPGQISIGTRSWDLDRSILREILG